jgi:hypothetical protein
MKLSLNDNCLHNQSERFRFVGFYCTGYMTLMKGVAGVPGDLYQIWTSPATMNANNPQAMYLTNQFKGHYKTDLSQWNRMCLDRVCI